MLINYEGFCGAQEIIGYLNSRLGLFDLSLTDVDILLADMGSDVQRVAALENKFILPCLAHVINLIARKVVLGLEEDDDNAKLVTGDEEEFFISTITLTFVRLTDTNLIFCLK